MSAPRFRNSWPMLLGRRPFARLWSWKAGIQFGCDLFYDTALLRIVLYAFNCKVLLLAFGYDSGSRYTLTKHPPTLWASIGLLGFAITWQQHDRLPT